MSKHDSWIVIPRWSEFQHGGKQRFPWIKAYTAQLHDADYLELSKSQRGLLNDLRMLYEDAAEKLPADPAYISKALQYRVRQPELDALVAGKWITILPRNDHENEPRMAGVSQVCNTSASDFESTTGDAVVLPYSRVEEIRLEEDETRGDKTRFITPESEWVTCSKCNTRHAPDADAYCWSQQQAAKHSTGGLVL